MQVSSLQEDQRKILETLRLAADSLKLTEHLAIVGSLARYLAGDPKLPRDVDVLIEKPVCERYWELVEILTKHGINSGWEVFDPPSFPTWSPCHPEHIAHAMHFAIGSSGNYQERDAGKLDFCFTVENLAKIPMSSRWIRWEIAKVSSGSLPVENIEAGHRDFIDVVRERERKLLAPRFSDAVQLYYRLVDTGHANPQAIVY
jgi:hypothetical protein